MKQKIAKIFLCFNLLLPGLYTSSVPGFSAVEVAAEDTPAGTVRGGVAILITFLLANGMRFIGHFDEIEQGITDLWDDFSAATGNTVSLMNLTAGAVLHLGYLRLNSSVQNAMTAFQNWLVAQHNIPDTGITDIATGAGVSYSVDVTASTAAEVGVNNSGTAYMTPNKNGKAFVALWPEGNNTAVTVVYVTDQSGSGFSYGGNWKNASGYNYSGTTYYVATRGIGYAWGWSSYTMPVNNFTGVITERQAIDLTYGPDATIEDTSIEADTLDLIDGWNLANDQARLLDLAVLQALVNRIGLTLDNIDDLIDDIPALYDIPWSTDFPDDPTLVDTPDDTIPWVDFPDSTVPADPSQDIPDTPAQEGEYKILGLERVFPFSLPFDLIAIVRVLRASPETPEFDVPMYDPAAGEVITEHVDLHDFDSWASIMRTGSTLFFLAGLILITRNLIRG